MIEAIKSIGSFVGLLTGAFVIFDRYMQGRPIATLSFPTENDRPSARLRIYNAARYDIAILGISVSKNVYGLADDMEAINIVRAAMARDQFFTLRPNETKELHLIARIKDGVPLETTPQKVNFVIFWRRCNSTWLPQMPVFVFTDTNTIRKFSLKRVDD